jgi:hypothetical protein
VCCLVNFMLCSFRGLDIDIFNLSSGRSQFYQQHPLGAPPSMFCSKVEAVPILLATPPTGSLRGILSLRKDPERSTVTSIKFITSFFTTHKKPRWL